jgi:hypothetical protein
MLIDLGTIVLLLSLFCETARNIGIALIVVWSSPQEFQLGRSIAELCFFKCIPSFTSWSNQPLDILAAPVFSL